MSDGIKQYVKMQKQAYDQPTQSLEWYKYHIVTRPECEIVFTSQIGEIEYINLFGDTDHSQHTALDFGCGVGRMIVNFKNKFKQIDGVDISPTCIAHAQEYLNLNSVQNTKLYICNGYDLRIIESNKYDVIYSMLVMEHICVHDIRNSYFKEFYRLLKSSGIICIMMKGGNKYKHTNNSASWYENVYNAPTTNSGYDVRIENLFDISNDLYSIGYSFVQFDVIPTPNEISLELHAGHQYVIVIRARK
jgi:SAM-dependent methyltransferase